MNKKIYDRVMANRKLKELKRLVSGKPAVFAAVAAILITGLLVTCICVARNPARSGASAGNETVPANAAEAVDTDDKGKVSGKAGIDVSAGSGVSDDGTVSAYTSEAVTAGSGASDNSETVSAHTSEAVTAGTGASDNNEAGSVKTGEDISAGSGASDNNETASAKPGELKPAKTGEIKKKETEPAVIYTPEENSRELARRIWSTMSAFKQMKDDNGKPVPNEYYGLRGEQICALLGNWEQESGLDPTAVEAVMNEMWSVDTIKKKASENDFITEYDWGSEDIAGYFRKHRNIYKAGIGLAQWTDTYTQVFDYSGYRLSDTMEAGNVGSSSKEDKGAGFIVGAEDDDLEGYDDLAVLEDETDIGAGDIDIAQDDDLLNDIGRVREEDESTNGSDDTQDGGEDSAVSEENTGSNGLRSDEEKPERKNVKPGRNTGLVEYAKNNGSKFYPEEGDGANIWDSEDRIISEDDTKGKWCDPVVQLAYMLDRSKGGDARAAWLHAWAETGEAVWHGDAEVSMEQLSDNELEGWTWREKAAFTPEHGWNPDLFYVADNKVSFTRETDTVRPVGDDTGDTDDFAEEDKNLGINDKTDNYYNTPNYGYIKEIKYDKWRWEDGAALSTSSKDWDRSEKDEHRESGIYAARKLAFEYAQRSADVAWHGRIDGEHGILGDKPEWNEYSKANGHDFICENNAAEIFIKENGIEKDGPYQHYGVIGDNMTKDAGGNIKHEYVYGWIMDKDPTQVANERAKEQYISTFKYIYRYHLYRYMTMYYTSQFLAEYEGVPGKAIEERQKNALKWFQMWWDSGMKGDNGTGRAEPNVYACEDPAYNKKGISDHFFKVDPRYAQAIMKNVER